MAAKVRAYYADRLLRGKPFQRVVTRAAELDGWKPSFSESSYVTWTYSDPPPDLASLPGISLERSFGASGPLELGDRPREQLIAILRDGGKALGSEGRLEVQAALSREKGKGARNHEFHGSATAARTDKKFFLDAGPGDARHLAGVASSFEGKGAGCSKAISTRARFFEELIRVCRLPLKIVTRNGKHGPEFDFKAVGGAKWEVNSSYGGPGDPFGPNHVRCELPGSDPADAVARMETALALCASPLAPQYLLSLWIDAHSSRSGPARKAYDFLRTADWPLTEYKLIMSLRVAGPEHLDSLSVLLPDERTTLRKSVGKFRLPAPAPGGKPRSGGLEVLTRRDGQQLIVRLSEEVSSELPRLGKRLGVTFQTNPA